MDSHIPSAYDLVQGIFGLSFSGLEPVPPVHTDRVFFLEHVAMSHDPHAYPVFHPTHDTHCAYIQANRLLGCNNKVSLNSKVTEWLMRPFGIKLNPV